MVVLAVPVSKSTGAPRELFPILQRLPRGSEECKIPSCLSPCSLGRPLSKVRVLLAADVQVLGQPKHEQVAGSSEACFCRFYATAFPRLPKP